MTDPAWSPPESDFAAPSGSDASWAPPESDFAPTTGASSNPSADFISKVQQERGGKPAIGDAAVNYVGDQLHAMGSGLYHTAIGAYEGMKALHNTHNYQAAAKAVGDEQAKAYQAPAPDRSGVTPELRPYVDDMETPTSPGALGDFADKHGAPYWLSAMAGAAPTISSVMMGGFKTPKAAALAPALTPEQAVANSVAHGNMGAAASVPDISGASPELRQAISATETPHLPALERHLDAEQLPLPEGMDPLRLRKGQATGDDQQISDEKNLRADPDTQGILSRSITDQNNKLGASITEIRRQATPDIVQRTNVEHDQAAINAIKSQDNAALTDIRAKYKALADANGGDLPIDTKSVVSSIDPILKQKSLRKTAEAHPVVSEIMDRLRSGEPIDFETFEDMRSQLSEVQRGADGPARKAASIVHNALNEMPLTPEAAPLRDLANTARDAARARFDTIKQNPGYKAVVNDNVPMVNGLHDLDAPSPLAGSFLNRFATGDSATAAPALIKRLKAAVPNPDLHQAIEAAPLNKLRDAAGIDEYGTGNFRNDQFRNYLKNNVAPKADALLSPQSIEHINRLKRVSGYVNDEGKASSTNRSNTGLTLQRFGAVPSTTPGLAGELANYGSDVAVAQIAGPVGHVAKSLGQNFFRKAREAKQIQSLRDAKRAFAEDATRPGAGLDYQPPRTPRATGGRIGPSEDELLQRLISKWKAAKKDTERSTKPLLSMPDDAVAKALRIAGRGL